jgi:hypothetical protein
MVSRWAFEALVVNQFMNNLFEKNIYPIEKEITSAAYHKGLWHNKMMELINHKDEISKQIVINELNKAGYIIKQPLLIDIADAKDFLTKLKQEHIEKYKKYTQLLDEYYIKKAGNDGQKNALENSKMKYQNERVEELVKNNRPLEEGIYAEGGYLHPNENNIYFDASNKNQIRSHFYAPRKYIAGRYFDTYTMNLFVIIAMTIFCLIALYYNLLKKLLDGIQNLAYKLKLIKE